MSMSPEEIDAEIERIGKLEREYLEEAVREGLLPASALARYYRQCPRSELAGLLVC